jgi:MGT family glycosyltransferase
MPTAYMFNMPYHGHINPCLAVIQELTKRGHRVVFYGVERFRAAAEAAGALFRSFEHEETERGPPITGMGEWQLRISERTMDRLIEDAWVDKPSYVLVDYICLWGRLFAQRTGLPTVVMHSTAPVTASRMELAYVTFGKWLHTRLLWQKLFRFLRADRRLSRQWNVPRIGMPFNLLYADYGDLHLVMTSPEMSDPTRFDARYAFVGPCIRQAGLTRGEPLPPRDERPLIYISLGTHFRLPPNFYRASIEAFRNAPVQVLISGVERTHTEGFGGLPDNIHVRKQVDQIEVLKRAAVFVTHGGMNSVCEGLMAEVPLLVYPQGGLDQLSQARYIEHAGAGLMLKHAEVTPDNLRSRVVRLLNDAEIRSRCSLIGRKLREAGGARRAADLIMLLCK